MSDHELLRKKALQRFLAFLFLCASLMLVGGCVSLFYGEFVFAFSMILAVVWTVFLMIFSYANREKWYR